MKKFVVGILNMFDNELKLFKIEAEDKYNAVKKAMIENCGNDFKLLAEEKSWQDSEDYPTNYEDLDEYLANAEYCINAIEV